jgi:hypothetical protein
MDPALWGASLWRSVHAVAMGYPERPSAADTAAYRRFYTELHAVLPCQTCADHYKAYVSSNPITDRDIASAEALFAWTVRLHNDVNARLGKPVISLDEAHEALARPLCAPVPAPTPPNSVAGLGIPGLFLGLGLAGIIVYVAWRGSKKK